MDTRPLVLVDGDPLTYRYGTIADPALAELQCSRALAALGTFGEVRLFLTTPGGLKGYRYHIAKTARYQETRSPSKGSFPSKGHIRAFLQRQGALEDFTLEADDLIATASRQHPGSYIYSIDKDMMQLRGVFIDPTTGLEVGSTVEGDSWWSPGRKNYFGWRQGLYQLLVGDKADNIKPLGTWKPLQARKLLDALQSHEEAREELLTLLEGAGITHERIVEQTALVALSAAPSPARRVVEFWGLTAKRMEPTIRALHQQFLEWKND